MLFEEVKLIQPDVYLDDRGFFMEAHQSKRLENLGPFVQDNLSYSKQGVIRGMHFQAGQNKFVSSIGGDIYDVVVDVRKGSPTFGKWKGYNLTAEGHEQLFVPDGFAHGFQVLSKEAYVLYKVSTFYDPKLEKGFYYADPDVNIDWPLSAKIVSERDDTAPMLKELL